MLTLSTLDGRFTQRFEVPFDEMGSLHAAVANQYGSRNPLQARLRPWMARIDIQFEPAKGRSKGKKINVSLGIPHKCNLRGKTARERLILDRYLRTWGLRREADQ